VENSNELTYNGQFNDLSGEQSSDGVSPRSPPPPPFLFPPLLVSPHTPLRFPLPRRSPPPAPPTCLRSPSPPLSAASCDTCRATRLRGAPLCELSLLSKGKLCSYCSARMGTAPSGSWFDGPPPGSKNRGCSRKGPLGEKDRRVDHLVIGAG